MTTVPTEEASPSVRQAALTGVGGWLFMFVLGQSATLLWLVYDLWSLNGIWARLSTLELRVQENVIVVAAADASMILIVAAALVATFRRLRRTPDVWVVALPTMAIVAFVRTAALLPDAASVGSTAASGAFRTLIVSGIWTIYWLRSKRVAATFGGRGGRTN
jgi:hypothetical protein